MQNDNANAKQLQMIANLAANLSKAQAQRLADIAWMGEGFRMRYEPDATWRALHKRNLVNGLGLTTLGASVLRRTAFADMLRHTPRDLT